MLKGGERIPKEGGSYMGTGKQTEQQYLPGAESVRRLPAAGYGVCQAACVQTEAGGRTAKRTLSCKAYYRHEGSLSLPQ